MSKRDDEMDCPASPMQKFRSKHPHLFVKSKLVHTRYWKHKYPGLFEEYLRVAKDMKKFWAVRRKFPGYAPRAYVFRNRRPKGNCKCLTALIVKRTKGN